MARIGRKEVSATFSCESRGDGAWEITLESRSGRRGGPTERNAEYKQALSSIIQLLALRHFVLTDALLASKTVIDRTTTEDERRISLAPREHPLTLSEVGDVPEFCRSLQREMSRMFSTRDKPVAATGKNGSRW
jgi:hypothetical protein